MSDFGNKSGKQVVFIPGFCKKKKFRPVEKCIPSWVHRAKVLVEAKIKFEVLKL